MISLVPPWALLAGLLGVMHGSLFHILFGERLRQLPGALALGLGGGFGGAWVGTTIPPAVLAVGDTNLIATTVAAWVALGLARLFRFC